MNSEQDNSKKNQENQDIIDQWMDLDEDMETLEEYDESFDEVEAFLEPDTGAKEAAELYLKARDIMDQQPQQALELLSRACDYFNQNQYLGDLIKSQLLSAKVLMKLNKYNEALEYINKILKNPEKRPETTIIETYQILSEIYLNLKNYQLSLDYYKKYLEVKAQYYKEIKQNNMDKLRKKYELEAKRKEAEIKKQKHSELVKINQELIQATEKIKQLTSLLPICAKCKKIRNDEGYWENLEEYMGDHTDAEFVASICPECRTNLGLD